jgi:hypothetical protein
VAIERFSGRWFYECTLLSDGLIQLGWANSMFRCDPVCGQGVGDHAHSWAWDGLRCKKWNVSCEPYGRRWKIGDIVGALIDMDLFEIRYYLNGEDLGQAFEDFSGHDVFPALSLNVRHCVRLNFGQYKFSHPPDELDGKSFRPVIQALQMPKPAATLAAKPLPGNTAKVKAASSPFGMKSPVAAVDATNDEGSDRIASTASHLSPLMERYRANQGNTASTESLLGQGQMTPLRQIVLSNLNTPAGAETPSTNMLTPSHTPMLLDSENAMLIHSIAEASAAEVLGSFTPTRPVASTEEQTAVVVAVTRDERQDNETSDAQQHLQEVCLILLINLPIILFTFISFQQIVEGRSTAPASGSPSACCTAQ